MNSAILEIWFTFQHYIFEREFIDKETPSSDVTQICPSTPQYWKKPILSVYMGGCVYKNSNVDQQ